MWDFFETVRHRHSVRKFQQQRPVEQEKLHAILEMASAAPTAGDLQSYRILVVQDAGKRAALAALSPRQAFIADAPVCLLFCADPLRAGHTFGERGRHLYALQDATIAATYAQLAVVASGLASTWVGDFPEIETKQLLGCAPELTPVALLALGYPAETPGESPRRPLEQVVVYC